MVSIRIALVFIIFFSLIFYVYRHSTIDTFYYLLLFFILSTILLMAIFVFEVAMGLYAFRGGRGLRGLVKLAKTGLKILNPLMFFLSFLMRGSKDELRRFYIDLNNSFVRSCGARYRPENVLMLLPHCLQNSSCSLKVTSDIGNCAQCGKCCIGDIRKISEELGIHAVVVTGGTAARNIAKKINPDIILSVACERDLASGIADMDKTTAIGLLNERPNGPCIDTRVDIEKLRSELKGILLDVER